MSEEKNRLLYVLSAKVSLGWSTFKRIFDELDAPDVRTEDEPAMGGRIRRMKTTRLLETLGHCDFEFGIKESSVHVAPATLVRLPQSGLPAAILAGARSPETQGKVEERCLANGCRFKATAQESNLALIPDRLLVEGDSANSILALAQSIGLHFDERPAAWLIVNFAGTLDDYLTRRCLRPGEMYERFGRWDCMGGVEAPPR